MFQNLKTTSQKRVVIFLTIDCLRQDHLKSYGYSRDTAPNQEFFVKKGTTFLNAIANGPETASSFSSIFTSILPYLNGGFSPLPNQKFTFPQILNENKVSCFGIHSNPNLGKFFNYHRGFNYFIEGMNFNVQLGTEENTKEKRDFFSLMNKSLLRKLRTKLFKELIFKLFNLRFIDKISNKFMNLDFLRNRIINLNRRGFTASYIINKIVTFLESYRLNNQIFIWAHFMDVHWPYNPPAKNLHKFTKKFFTSQEKDFLLNDVFWQPKGKLNNKRLYDLVNLYDGEINYVDDKLIRLLKLLEKRFKKNCLVIITSDHGEGFYEHKFLNHGGYAYDELLKIPLFIVEIGNRNVVRSSNELVQLIDIGPTILDYFKIKKPDLFQGTSLLPILEGKSLERENFVISESYRKNGRFIREKEKGFRIFSIRTQKWKYILNEEEKKEYLFNLIEDPDELENLIEKKTEIVKKFIKIKNFHFQNIKKSDEMSKIMHAVNGIDFKTI